LQVPPLRSLIRHGSTEARPRRRIGEGYRPASIVGSTACSIDCSIACSIAALAKADPRRAR
jgi:hypothetical protein